MNAEDISKYTPINNISPSEINESANFRRTANLYAIPNFRAGKFEVRTEGGWQPGVSRYPQQSRISFVL